MAKATTPKSSSKSPRSSSKSPKKEVKLSESPKKEAKPSKSPQKDVTSLKEEVKSLQTSEVEDLKESRKDDLRTGVDQALVEKAVVALLNFHKKQTADKLSLLGNDRTVQVQFTLLRSPGNHSPKPIRLLIPHPLYKLCDANQDENAQALEEPEVCLIVKEESKPWVQAMIEKFPSHMGCIKKVLGLQSLRKKHAQYAQRRELLHKYTVFMADDRILPMLSKALGKDFYQAKKLPIPITLTRKEALPFAIQKALSATFMTISEGTCISVRYVEGITMKFRFA